MRTKQRAAWVAGISAAIIAGLTTTGMLGASRASLAAPQQTAQVEQAAVTASSARAAPMTMVDFPTKPPNGAILLFTGDPAQIGANWTERYAPQTPAKWAVDKGIATPEGHDITSRQSFGDCYLHAEFIIPKPGAEKPAHGGNAGFGLQGRYEIQVFDSYGKAPESHGCGALYSQKAALVNASKPAGQWQTFDIIFRAPRFGADGAVTEQARATVFQNGILVQNNEAFNGPTGIQYSEYKTEAKTGPIIIQGNHDIIPIRNVWVVPTN